MMRYVLITLFLLVSCAEQPKQVEQESTPATIQVIQISKEDSLAIDRYWKMAQKNGLYSTKRQQYLDSALSVKPDSAYFWQQKAMPLYKQRKYSLGKPFLEKAAEHNPKSYLDYSAFMKCIFSKEYIEAIAEFKKYEAAYGEGYVMDHTYNFYTALAYLQLNEFEKAKEYLEKSKMQQIRDFPNEVPTEACHYMDWFYMGITEYELQHYETAIENFEIALRTYGNFADALYYKAACLHALGKDEEAKEIFNMAIANKENTINEDQVFYEVYPYQVFNRLGNLSRNN